MFIRDTSYTEFIDVDLIMRIKKVVSPAGQYTVHVYTSNNMDKGIVVLSGATEEEAIDLIQRIGQHKDRNSENDFLINP